MHFHIGELTKKGPVRWLIRKSMCRCSEEIATQLPEQITDPTQGKKGAWRGGRRGFIHSVYYTKCVNPCTTTYLRHIARKIRSISTKYIIWPGFNLAPLAKTSSLPPPPLCTGCLPSCHPRHGCSSAVLWQLFENSLLILQTEKCSVGMKYSLEYI